MAKMGSPYLESGESLILTTDRVSVNTVQYDVLLTTRYLILVDIRYAHFQPQMIPLLTIQSVKGGKTANGELVITLFFTETGSSNRSESMVLLFSQQPGEQRKRERDDWIKTLMGLIVSVRQETSYEGIITADPEVGIRPSKRRQISPEIPHPYTKVVESRPAQIELVIIPDEPESVFSEEIQELPEISSPADKTESDVTPGLYATEETSDALQDLSGLQDMLSPSLPVIEETPGPSQEASESPHTLLPPIPVFEEPPVISKEMTVSTDAISLPLPVFEETPVVSQELTVSTDTITPPIYVFEETPGYSPEVAESPTILSPPAKPITVESVLVPEEESESQDLVILVPAFEELPDAPEAGSGTEKRGIVSLLAAVKSLSSPPGRTDVPDTVLPPLTGIEETPVASPEVTRLPNSPLHPEVPKIVASSYFQEEKAEPIRPPETSTIEEKPVDSQEDTVSPGLPPSPEPVTVESTEVPQQDSQHSEPVSPEAGKGAESVQQSASDAPPPHPGPPRSDVPGSRQHTFIAVAAIILIILGIAGVMVFSLQNSNAPVVEPTALPTPTIQQTPQPTPVIIPPTGVWVRVSYPRTYYGWVGNTGSIRGVNGSGDQIYKIPEIDGFVQAQIFKPDNSGDTLTVKVYRDGDVISVRNVSIPMGSIELLIDAKTGNPPGMTPVVTPSGNQTGSNGGRIMYF